MPDDPNRNIEEQVNAWARRRRAEASEPFEPHSATRKRLHDEVARTYADQSGKSRVGSAWLAMLWPRLVWALPVLLATTVIVVLLLPSMRKTTPAGQSPFDLAQRVPAPELDQAIEARPSPRATVRQTVSSDDIPAGTAEQQAVIRTSPSTVAPASIARDQVRAEESIPSRATSEGLDLRRESSTSPQPRAERSIALALADEPEPATPRPALPQVARAPPGGAPYQMERAQAAPGRASRSPVDGPSLAGGAGSLEYPGTSNTDRSISYSSVVPGLEAGQHFVRAQSYRRNLNSPPMPDVLQSFQFVQSGQNVIIVDADGSTYTGQIDDAPVDGAKEAEAELGTERLQAMEQASRTDSSRLAARTGRESVTDGSGQVVWFRVLGTNRTLEEPIIFRGNLQVPEAGSTLEITSRGTRVRRLSAASAPAPGADNARVPQSLQNARVLGELTIGDRQRIEIDALPAAR